MSKIKTTKINVIDRIIIIFVPIFLGIIIGLIVDYLLKNINYRMMATDGLDLVKTVIDVWGILLGFVITAVSILLTIGENSFISTLVETNHMKSIILSYVVSSIYLLIAIIFSMILLVLKVWNRKIFIIFLGINICIMISIGICIYFLFTIALKIHG